MHSLERAKKNPAQTQYKTMAEDKVIDADYMLMGLTKKQYLNKMDQLYFMKKHQMDCTKHHQIFKNIQFSKEFFSVINKSEKGLCVRDLEFWLISLGLAVDINFVKKIMKILAPKKFMQGSFDNNSLTVNEFSSLFRVDPPNQKLVKVLNREVKKMKEKEAMLAQQQALTKKATLLAVEMISPPFFEYQTNHGIEDYFSNNTSPNNSGIVNITDSSPSKSNLNFQRNLASYNSKPSAAHHKCHNTQEGFYDSNLLTMVGYNENDEPSQLRRSHQYDTTQ